MCGACGRSGDEQLGSITNYLRPDDKHYSVLLACFFQGDTGEALDKKWHPRFEQLQDVTHFAELQTEVSRTLQGELNQLRERGEPLHSESLRCMQRFPSLAPRLPGRCV